MNFVAKVDAHEVYVLTPGQVESGLQIKGVDLASALNSPNNLQLTLVIGTGIVLLLVLFFLLQKSSIYQHFDSWLKRFNSQSERLLRTILGISIIFGALQNSFLGPEISLQLLSTSPTFKILLLVIGMLLILGRLTRIAALSGIIIFGLFLQKLGLYPLIYLHYIGELSVLASLSHTSRLKDLEHLIIRATFGLALIYAAVNIKLIHPTISLMVVNQYHLTQYNYLFPSDPLLVVLGAAIVEVLIGAMIIFGFQIRLAALVSLFYITLSLVFFREAVWPHMMLYGVLIYLLVNGAGKYSVDNRG